MAAVRYPVATSLLGHFAKAHMAAIIDSVRVVCVALALLALPVSDLRAGHPGNPARLAILAPHPDDEILACGGLIQQALARGDSVWVVYLTSGDASWTSAAWSSRRLPVGPAQYLNLGRTRMTEARAGATRLGINPDCLIFLGYPDQGLARLWCEHWQEPFLSPTTGVDRNPYVSDGREYSGQNLLGDLTTTLLRLRPDHVYSPHPLDNHADHWATAAFVALALEHWPGTEPRRPSVFYYAPLHGFGRHQEHVVVQLTSAELDLKLEALCQHATQLEIPGNRLEDVSHRHETFDTTHLAGLPAGENGPVTEFVRSALVNRLDLISTDSGRLVQLALETEPWTELDYRLLLHAVFRQDGSVRHKTLAIDLAADDQPPSAIFVPAADSALADSLQIEPTACGWNVSLPGSWLQSPGAVFCLAEVCWRGIPLNHSGPTETDIRPH